MSPKGNGGSWNRAGRRSGGARPALYGGGVELWCKCGSKLEAGLLEQRRVGDLRVKICSGCDGVVWVEGLWLVAKECQ